VEIDKGKGRSVGKQSGLEFNPGVSSAKQGAISKCVLSTIATARKSNQQQAGQFCRFIHI
jgi:hypothetical protein